MKGLQLKSQNIIVKIMNDATQRIRVAEQGGMR